MTVQEIQNTYQKGLQAVVELVQGLLARISELEKQNQALRDRLQQNSRNSSRPPASDFPKPPKNSNRSRRSGRRRRPGGQKGHPGSTLQWNPNPDHVCYHTLSQCQHCHAQLDHQQDSDWECRQVLDLPVIKMGTTEHQAEVKRCDQCGHTNHAGFPSNVASTIQYGPNVLSWTVYLRDYQLLPAQRTAELFSDCFGQPISPGTVEAARELAYQKLQPFEDRLKERLRNEYLLHLDETGIRINGRTHWLHVCSTKELTFYLPHPNRGQKAIEDIDILTQFEGMAVHDGLASYISYDCGHSLCNNHHLRRLQFLIDQYQLQWPKAMIERLLTMKEIAETAHQNNRSLTDQQLYYHRARYEEILAQARQEHEAFGQELPSKARALYRLFEEYPYCVLAFFYNPNIPFDNNQGERDLRMAKTQQKISGSFRSFHGAEVFCRLRSYISTIKKQGLRVFEAIRGIFTENYFQPAPPQLE